MGFDPEAVRQMKARAGRDISVGGRSPRTGSPGPGLAIQQGRPLWLAFDEYPPCIVALPTSLCFWRRQTVFLSLSNNVPRLP